jgi:RNA polymerase sigma-70 factor (ECF subfamily)
MQPSESEKLCCLRGQAKRHETLRGESRFTTWAQKIAVRVAFSELRRLHWKDISLQDLISQCDIDLRPVVLADKSVSPEQRTAQRMMLETVQRFIAEGLTERQRQALTATVMQGMSPGEVACQMDTNRNALYKLLYDARQRLKKHVMAEGLSAQDVLAAST